MKYLRRKIFFNLLMKYLLMTQISIVKSSSEQYLKRGFLRQKKSLITNFSARMLLKLFSSMSELNSLTHLSLSFIVALNDTFVLHLSLCCPFHHKATF